MSVEQLISLPVLVMVIPIFFISIAAELIAVRYFKQSGSLHAKDDAVSIFMGLFSVISNGSAAFLTLAMLVWAQQYQITALPLTVATLVACFVLDDLRYYLHHRLAHRVRWPWAMHVIHHSSQRFSMAVALRQGWTKHFTGTTVLKVPLVLIGFDPIMVIFCGAVNAIYQFFLHTETIDKLPRWFEAVFNTPSHHRVHHGNNPQYLDRNYAGTLIIWDKMFGTFAAEDPNDLPDYGLVKDVGTFNPLVIFGHEYLSIIKDVCKRGLTLKQRLLYIIAPPGWTHDGSRLTSEDMKRAAGLLPDKTPAPGE